MDEQTENQPPLQPEMPVGSFLRVKEESTKGDIEDLVPSQRNLSDKQENTRSKLATSLINILAGTLIGSFALIVVMTIMIGLVSKDKEVLLKEHNAWLKDMITLALTAQTGLIGSALGFYFGSRGNNSD
jgi:small-conductance mechanosensitive channel